MNAVLWLPFVKLGKRQVMSLCNRKLSAQKLKLSQHADFIQDFGNGPTPSSGIIWRSQFLDIMIELEDF